MSDERQIMLLMTALAIGLLIGTERGWHTIQEEKPHVAGVRTFGLIGLLGGVIGLTTQHLAQAIYGLVFVALAGAVVTAYVLSQRKDFDPGVTSLVAALLTFSLGALATLGHAVAAAAAGVVSALLLGFKPVVHRWIERVEEHELRATLKLLLITVVLLPALPNRGYGPGGALNPYEIWWMVVLIACISFAGYFAVRALGTEKGMALTSLFAGLASSTALTVHFARLARRPQADANLLASGILLATATLFPRILVIAAILHRDLALALTLPLAVMALVVLGPGLLAWRRRDTGAKSEALPLDNPLELGAALRFGVLLAAVMWLAQVLGDRFGGTGVLALGAISGVADLNAITLSVARMGQDALDLPLAVLAVLLACVSNGLFKSGVAWMTGGTRLGLKVALPVLAASLSGPAAVLASGNWPTW